MTYSISSGNVGGPFTINASTGAITVANGALLNFETYSTRWDVPAAIPVFVTITDAANPALNETIRVVVTLTNVNEAPTLTGGVVTMLAHTLVGTPIFTVASGDPDQFDFATLSFSAGNTGNAFTLDPFSGVISVAASLNVSTATTYTLTVRATDQGTPALTTDATVAITVLPLDSAYTPGTITRAIYENITGGDTASLVTSPNFPYNPDSEQTLTSTKAVNHGINYGDVMHGYVIPPTTGDYTFWIASDDTASLAIGKTASAATAVGRASNSSPTGEDVFTTYASQQSIVLALTAGSPYYFETRHKQGVDTDHLSVAWQGPGIAQQIIPAKYLAPFYQNYFPRVAAATWNVRRDACNGSVVGTATATDVNAQDTETFSISGGTGSGLFSINPTTGKVQVANGAGLVAGTSYTLTVNAKDSGTPARTGTATMTVNTLAATGVNVAANSILQQVWTNMSGSVLSGLTGDARYPFQPTAARGLSTFEGPSGYGNNYGTRIRALVTPATTGSYTFYISSDDSSSLLFSGSSSAAGAAQIAGVTGYSSSGVYNAQASQTSAAFILTAGQSYYLEALQKQGDGGDFLQVAWMGPGSAAPTIIPGSALTPYNINLPPTFQSTSYAFPLRANAATGTAVGSVAAKDPEGGAIAYAILAGNSSGGFALDPLTGTITVANGVAITPGQTLTLTVGAQDDGIGALYPLASVTAPVTITIPKAIDQWRQDNFGANAGNTSIAGNLADPDGDGLNNLLEYAFGTIPILGNSPAVTTDLETTGGSTYLRLTVTKNPAATDVTYTVEVTGDLATPGSWSDSGVVLEVNSTSTLRARDAVPMGATAGKRFMRVRVSVP